MINQALSYGVWGVGSAVSWYGTVKMQSYAIMLVEDYASKYFAEKPSAKDASVRESEEVQTLVNGITCYTVGVALKNLSKKLAAPQAKK